MTGARNVRLWSAITALVSCLCCLAQTKPRDSDYDVYGFDTKNAVQLTPDLLHLLAGSEADGLTCEDPEHLSDRNPDSGPQIFCSRMAPSFHSGENYIVIGDGELSGNHASPIWILHRDERGAKLIFYGDEASGIWLGPRRTNGYPDILGTSGYGDTVVTEKWRFVGRRYTKVSHVEEEEDPNPPVQRAKRPRR